MPSKKIAFIFILNHRVRVMAIYFFQRGRSGPCGPSMSQVCGKVGAGGTAMKKANPQVRLFEIPDKGADYWKFAPELFVM
jgi:hypothetical protein